MHPRLTAALTVVLSVCTLVCTGSAYADDDHPALRLGADVAVGAGLRYRRELDEFARTETPGASAQLGLSVHYLFSRYAGLGLQASGAYVPVHSDGFEARIWALDLGPSPVLRIPLARADLTVRMPFGLTYGAATTRDELVQLFGTNGGVATSSNRMGPGAHVAGLVGAVFWLGPHVGLRLETGPTWRTYRVKEAGALVLDEGAINIVQQDVRSRLVTWVVQLGLEWAPG